MIAAWSNGVDYESDVSGRANLCILKQASYHTKRRKMDKKKGLVMMKFPCMN